MSVTFVAALAALLAAPLPTHKGVLPKTPSAATPNLPDAKSASTPTAGPKKAGPKKKGASPTNPVTPEVSRLSFVFITPPEFTAQGLVQLQGNSSKVNTVTNISGWAGGSSLVADTGSRTLPGEATARVNLPLGARVRWLECALDGLESGDGSHTTRVTASLLHARYADHPFTTPPAELGAVQVEMTDRAGNNGRTFVGGIAIDGARATATPDGWFTLHVNIVQGTALGLRGCRIGYLPAPG